jgi:hypothetical protein
MSLDLLFDVLAVLIFVVIPFALALIGLAWAIRTPSLVRRVVGYVVAVAGSWIGIVATVSVVRCPSQDGELCGEESGVAGDVGTQVATVLGITVLLVLLGQARRHRLRQQL